jgi:hypothetical protein
VCTETLESFSDPGHGRPHSWTPQSATKRLSGALRGTPGRFWAFLSRSYHPRNRPDAVKVLPEASQEKSRPTIPDFAPRRSIPVSGHSGSSTPKIAASSYPSPQRPGRMPGHPAILNRSFAATGAFQAGREARVTDAITARVIRGRVSRPVLSDHVHGDPSAWLSAWLQC